MKIHFILFLGAATLIAGCSKQSNVEKASREFSALPPSVQQTVRRQAPNAEVADVVQRKRDGRVVYEINFRDSTRNPAMVVADDGSMVNYEKGKASGKPGVFGGSSHGSEEPINLSALPLPVQRAIQEQAPKAEVAKVSRVEKNGVVFYEIEYAGRGSNPTMLVSEDGTTLQPLRRSEGTHR